MQKNQKKGELCVVATPLGNLRDITLRALDILKEADFIACEDTRVTAKLLRAYQIDTKMISFHQYSREKRVDELISLLKKGKKIALVTDSGTPGVSDPGRKVIEKIIEKSGLLYDKIEIRPLPGPSALTAALSVSGAPSKDIYFLGFFPKKRKRKKIFERIKKNWREGITTVFFESPYRIKKTILELSNYVPLAKMAVMRELTKKFEELIFISVRDWKTRERELIKKGEFVIIIYPRK